MNKALLSATTDGDSAERPAELPADEYLCNQIFEAILSQRLQPGTKLPEDDLADIFKVSRAVVRRALLKLSWDDVVQIRPHRGATVSSPSVRRAREVLSVRRLIEREVIRQAVREATDEDIEELRDLVGTEQRCFERGDTGAGLRLSGDFHLRLAELSGNVTLLKILRSLVPQTALIIAQYEKPGHGNCSHDEHFALIDVLAERDGERAAAMMDEHIDHIEHKLALSDDAALNDLRRVFAHVVDTQT